MKVLVADDDDDSRELLRVSLDMQDIHVVGASGGAECVRLAQQEHPDAIVLDVMMPFMDGPATLAALRANPITASIPVIFLTASVMPSEVRRLEGTGARAVLAKPIEPAAFRMRLLEILGTPTPRADLSLSPARAVAMEELRPEFLRRTRTRLDEAARLLALLRSAPATLPPLQELLRFFHGVAGVGTSFGFPRATALAKEGELECMALLHDRVCPSAVEIDNWTKLLAALAHELAEGSAGSASEVRAAVATRLPEVLVVSPHPEVAATLIPLLDQEGNASRWLTTRAEASEAFAVSLPQGLIVDAILDGDSGYELIAQLRRLPAGETVPALVVGARTGFVDRVNAIHGGADGYFEEPLDAKALMVRLQQLLEANQVHPARILSVEDDPHQAAYLRWILESAGYEVSVCEDPKRFEALLSEAQPDLVLMDILLPDISGYDLVRYLRQDERHATLPVLFLTTEGQLQSRFRSAHVGGDEHLTKPVVPAVLLSAVASRLERARLLRNLLDRDGLTRLYTHTAVIQRAQALHTQKTRDVSRPFAWVMIDVDHFKSVNDRFGHPVGDRVLASLAALLRRRLRQSDTIGRYGGEEFVVLFGGLAEHEVLRLMGRVLEEFRDTDLEAPGRPSFRVSFSAGVAMLGQGATVDEWKKAADDALYASKEAGRNRVTASVTSPATA